MGVPTVLGGAFGISTFVILGLGSLIGGAGILAPALGGLGVALVVGGGTGFLLRNRRPKKVRLIAADAEMPEGTRAMLEKDRKSTRLNSSHRHTSRMPSSA